MKWRNWYSAALAAWMLGVAPWSYGKDPQPPAVAAESEAPAAPAEAVFEFLVAEVAAQRGDVEAALAIYNRMARELRDPQLARRSVEMAVRSRAFDAAIETMRQTGIDMSEKYKETSRGGLAVNVVEC